MKKSFKTVISVALIFSVISLVSGAKADIKSIDFNTGMNDDIVNNYDFQKTVDNQNIEATCKAIELVISENLADKGIADAEITVLADISKDKDIYITEVAVACNRTDLELCREVLLKLNIDAEITERN